MIYYTISTSSNFLSIRGTVGSPIQNPVPQPSFPSPQNPGKQSTISGLSRLQELWLHPEDNTS